MALRNNLRKLGALSLFLLNCTYYYIFPQQPKSQAKPIVQEKVVMPTKQEATKYSYIDVDVWFLYNDYGRIKKMGFRVPEEFSKCKCEQQKRELLCSYIATTYLKSFEHMFRKGFSKYNPNQFTQDLLRELALRELVELLNFTCINQINSGDLVRFRPNYSP
ncbi:MAG: hypothetical protein QXP53_01375 [Candidatus Pacearchaeota archaeon]